MAQVVITITDMPDGTVVFDYNFGPNFVPPESEADVDKLTRAEQCGGMVAQFLSGLVMQSEAHQHAAALAEDPAIILPTGRK